MQLTQETAVTESQCLYLCFLLCRLKRSRTPWVALPILAAISNLFTYPLIHNWIGNIGLTLRKTDAADFAWNSAIVMDFKAHPHAALTLFQNLRFREKLPKDSMNYFFNSCLTKVQCERHVFKRLYGRINSSTYTAYVDYPDGESQVPSITCLIAHGEDLYCPFFGHLVASSHNRTLYKLGRTFGRARFFSLVSRSGRSRFAGRSASTDTCARHENFDLVISRTVAVQTMLLIGASFLYFLLSTISSIMNLKKNGFLKIMFQKGLSVRSYWLAVWIITLAESLIIAVIFSVSHTLQCPDYYRSASIFAIFLAATLQLLSIAAMGFLLTVLFEKYFHVGLTTVLIATCACAVVAVNHLLLPASSGLKALFLFFIPIGHFGEFTRAHLLAAFLPDSLMAYHHLIFFVIVVFPIATVGVTLYCDFIFKTGNGYCLPAGYITDKRFWTDQAGTEEEAAAADPLPDVALPDMANVEKVAETLKPIVCVSRVGKLYSTRRCFLGEPQNVLALKDVSTHIYEGQITAIIGHNGSGKTTLLNIMNGTELPTAGQVSVNGWLVNDPINRLRLRRLIGICPQENSLSSCLTVLQTLQMALVSCSRCLEQSSEIVEKLLCATRLNSKRHHRIDQISSGMRRKLCTAVALIVGDSKVLFLDEPTSGVDPVSRRRLWKLLQEYKSKCSIILSTQSMDEADTLADRKIFLSGGSVVCAGSSLFLKSAFDCGFNFNVTLKSPTYAPLLIKQIKDDFEMVQVKCQFDVKVQFCLPASETNKLAALATALERRSEWIAELGLLQASLYDIFMRLRDIQPDDVEEAFRTGGIRLLDKDRDVQLEQDGQRRLQTLLASSERATNRSHLQSIRAMAYINVIRMLRSRVKLGIRIATPIVLLLTLLVMAIVEKTGDSSRIQLHNNLTNYGNSIDRGVCVYQASSGDAPLNSSACEAVFKGSFKTLRSLTGKGFLALQKPQNVEFYAFLNEESRIEQIKSLCQSGGSLQTECPIVYVDTWKATVPNADRTIYVGSFSTFSTVDSFNSSFGASATIGAYYRLLRHFLDDEFSTGSIGAGAFKFKAKSIYEFRSTFIALYGIFLQLTIISFLPATFLDDLIEDKETRVRNQLSSFGLGTFSYWITMYFVHYIQYAIVYLISVLLVVSINPNGYADAFYLAGIVLPTLICGLSNNQLSVYILGSLLNKSNPIVTVAYFFFSIFLVVILLFLQLDNVAGIVVIALVPPYASIALTLYGTKAIFYTMSFFKVDSFARVSKTAFTIYTSQPHILGSLMAVVVHSLILVLILSVLEHREMLFRWVKFSKDSARADIEVFGKERDDDVLLETARLDDAPRNANHLLETRHLKMKFPNGAMAVRDVTFAASPGEIFGLLGPNGAGKSTAMAVMVGDLTATGGCCEVRCGDGWLPNRAAARQGYIGYCPQYNPQYDNVTVREHLEFYACILGVSKSDASEQVNLLLEGMDLEEHKNKVSSQLSYGYKRRLSLAASLLGNPCLLVVDEVSTGVDPEGKRFIWKCLRAVSNERRCTVITTQSMEEAEALFSHVAVMNHGLLVGVGSVQGLKRRYGQLYTLELLIDTERSESVAAIDAKKANLMMTVFNKYNDAVIVEEFADRITFSIPMTEIGRLSHALTWLTEIKEACHILYFSFHELSLDQVFTNMITRDNTRMVREAYPSIFSESGNTIRKSAA